MLLVTEKADPERFEVAARRWLAMLCEDRQSARTVNPQVDLLGVAQAAAALDALPTRRPAACAAHPLCFVTYTLLREQEYGRASTADAPPQSDPPLRPSR
jgi:hypothetical protein